MGSAIGTRGRVVVVGAGITGLATGHALAEGGADVVALEASARCGGNVRTTRRDGCVLDEGPDSWVASKPAATLLARRLGLADELIGSVPGHRTTYIASEHGLEALPDGMMLGVPTRLWPMVRTPLLSMRGKLRAAFDLVAPCGYRRAPGDDESIGAFVARRLGAEVRDRIAQPLLGGIFHSDVDRLSLRATFPQLAAFEKRGGLIRGSRTTARGSTGSPFVALRDGLESLPAALAASLGDRVHRRIAVTRIERRGKGFALRTPNGDLFAHDVVLTVPAHIAATILESLDLDIAHELASIRFTSATTVFLGFPDARVDATLHGSGYIVPSSLNRPASAVTWVTKKWAHRAPAGITVLRVFLPTTGPTDDEAVAMAYDEVRCTLGARGDPSFSHVARFPLASPLPEIGHLARVDRIRTRLTAIGGVHLAGNGYDGFGLSNCVRQGEELARALLDRQTCTNP